MQTFYKFDHLAREEGVLHAVTQKDITKDYAFSLALHTGENEADIVSNRGDLARDLSIGEDSLFVAAKQTHSNHVVVVESRVMRGWSEFDSAIEDCDALVTNQDGVILTVLSADCVPILLYDPTKGVVAVVHAGWRGTQKEIVIKTIDTMRERFICNPCDILAGVAPAIGGCCYEVGHDVVLHFLGYEDAIEKKEQKYMLNLPKINQEQMISAGIKSSNIEMSGICTSCSSESYFSYRKEQGCSGRFMSLIGLR